MIEQIQAGGPIFGIFPGEETPLISIHASLLNEFLAERRDPSHVTLGIEPLHQRGLRGKGVLIAIADTGCDPDHPDLKSQLVPDLCRNFTKNATGWTDVHGHGSHCAGIAAAAANDNGIIGIAPEAKLMACKVLSDEGSGSSAWIAAGIRHAADSGADIISLSLGGPTPDGQTRDTIDYALNKGCWVVCAAGNDGRVADSYPGHYPACIAVAACDNQAQRASFSTINKENDIAAPGVNIFSCQPGGRYASLSGTSMATPAISGCLALVRGELKRLGVAIPKQDALLAALKKTARDITPAGPDTGTGWGLIDTGKLLAELTPALPPVPPVPPIPVPTPGGWVLDLTEVDFTPAGWRKIQASKLSRWTLQG